jgi:hypothetical protein
MTWISPRTIRLESDEPFDPNTARLMREMATSSGVILQLVETGTRSAADEDRRAHRREKLEEDLRLEGEESEEDPKS